MARYEMTEPFHAEIAGADDMGQAYFNLGMMYSSGRTIEPDYVVAHKWFNLAAREGNNAALDYRAEIAREMTRDDISLAQRQAREWLEMH